MRCLLFHAKHFHTEVVGLAKRPKGITPEKVNKQIEDAIDAIVVFVTVEKGDNAEKCSSVCVKDVSNFTEEVGVSTVVLCPFAHLSHALADSKTALETLDQIDLKLREAQLKVHRVHFGSDKSLLLDIYGHGENVRFREY
ncbi:MAG: threonyl-tRNA synthetase editing domain-containing protein [Patescibacteria group bacterium]